MLIRQVPLFVALLAALSLTACGSTTDSLQSHASGAWESAKSLVADEEAASVEQEPAAGPADISAQQEPDARKEEPQLVSLEDACGWKGQLGRATTGFVSSWIGGMAAIGGYMVSPVLGSAAAGAAPYRAPYAEKLEQQKCDQLKQLALLCDAGNPTCERTLKAEAQRNFKNFRELCKFSDFAGTEPCMASDQELLAEPLG